MLYDAKCVKIKTENGNFFYFVHYQGWNKNWDEWCDETRILKANNENVELQQRLTKECEGAPVKIKKKSSKSGTGTPKDGSKKGSGQGSANTSRASTPVSERSFKIGANLKRSSAGGDDDKSTSSHEDEALARRAIKRTRLSESLLDDSERFRIDIPEELKYVLVSDMDLVNMKKSLFGLPAKASVSSILNEYIKYAEKAQLEGAGAGLNEVILGIRDIFDATVGSHLLYKNEKTQFSEKVVKERIRPSSAYGSAHLLRLMVKISSFLNRSSIAASSEANVNYIEAIICDFLLYLETNRSRLFTSKNYTECVEEATTLADSDSMPKD